MSRELIHKIVEELAPKLKAKFIKEPEYERVACLILKNGERIFFDKALLDINCKVASRIAKDKHYSHVFLQKFGYKTTFGKSFYSQALVKRKWKNVKRSLAEGLAYAEKIGFPVIVKPNSSYGGKVVTKAHHKRDFIRAFREVELVDNVVLVEKFHPGLDVRAVIYDKEFICAYWRKPCTVVGNGRSTLAKLLGQDPKKLTDFRILTNIKRHKLTLNSVLKRGQQVTILDNANLSDGGAAEDVTHLLPDSFKKFCVKITKDMGLDLCGIDFLLQDFQKPLNDYVIIEVNSNPQMNHFTKLGRKQKQLQRNLLTSIIKKMIRLRSS
jgi:D-alanine-D-alanine ligase-like ATP-grasp enzyme